MSAFDAQLLARLAWGRRQTTKTNLAINLRSADNGRVRESNGSSEAPARTVRPTLHPLDVSRVRGCRQPIVVPTRAIVHAVW